MTAPVGLVLPLPARTPAVGIVALAAAASATIGFVGPTQPLATFAVLGLAVALGFAFVLPVSWLPTLALLTILVLPAESLPLPSLVRFVPVGLFFLVVWQLRTRSTAAPRLPTIVAVGALAVWIAMSFLFAGMLSARSVTWTASVLLALGVFALRPPAASEARRALAVFTAAASGLATFAIVESFVLGANPVLGEVFAAATNWGSDANTGIRRATTLIGHPLMNGTIFAVAAVLVVGRLFELHRPNRTVDYVQLALLVAGVAASQTRTGAIAAVVGLLLVVAFSRDRGNRLRRLSFLGLGLLLLAFFALALSQRNSAGLDFTVNHRASVPGAALASIEGHEVFGVGPSMSDEWRLSKRLAGTAVTLENGYAQLFVSLGPIGMTLFVANLLVAIGIGLARAASRAPAAGLATLALAIAGFNAAESAPRLLVLLAVLVAAIYAYGSPRLPASNPPTRESTA